ncbi:MAG: lysylphosphatidylglycerol synthase transmembrane domain-containing protein [Caldilinea sp.]|uniref:lysylphosphatidylglycerol synthase transmembrane domain-containing protein n=1 Tax=Caldilinea sp. TaxID=2293560 RepID=UPI002C9C418E|nr:flippase-like domain-containing protein [Anaerolineales bacterium]HQY92493.1 lysylphosphatidylglycerol synthase transmembrane domain-containing protein [Caldilinea sp.]HRA64367.1 lysylphosphatidylglycerol synthase transmembrane domain-containing protein [Caldilinea sp.]
MTKSRLGDLLKLGIAIALLIWLVLKLPDPAALWWQIVHANKWLLLLGAACYTGAVAISALKWGVLLRAAGIDLPRSRLLSYQWMAEFFNNFLPAQVGGDVMRGYAVAVDTRRKADAAASVMIDRFIGLMIFMLFAALSSNAVLLWGKPDGQPFSPEGAIFMRFAAVGSSLAAFALLVVVMTLLSRRLKRLMERLLAVLPFSARTLPLWGKLAAAFDVYRDHPKALLLTALGSTSIVILTSVNIWLIARAIQPDSISLLEVLVINPIIVFALIVVPLSPGGLGVRQVSFAGLFLFMGAGYQLGAAVGLLQQFIGYLVSIPGGILWARGGRRQQTPSAPPPMSVKPH